MLDVQNLGVSFGGEVLFENLSFRIGRGDRIGLIGKNGAGKSTIFKIIVGLEYPNTGTGMLLGEELTAVSAKNKHRIGIVSEQIELLFTILAILSMLLEML